MAVEALSKERMHKLLKDLIDEISDTNIYEVTKHFDPNSKVWKLSIKYTEEPIESDRYSLLVQKRYLV